MKKRTIAFLSLLLALCLLGGCAGKKEPLPPPDLTGDWKQESEDEWYHIATISEDKIEIWWYLAAYDKRELYWSGSFVPPTDGKEPYTWESTNRYTADQLNVLYSLHRASREETKTFTYKNGELTYNVTAGHLRLGFTLKRADGESAKTP